MLVTLILKIVDVDPPVLFAQIVQDSQDGCTSLATPEIVPLAELNWNPEGRLGDICHESGVPPKYDGVIEICSPIVKSCSQGLYNKFDTGISATLIRTSTEIEPPELEAVILCMVRV